MGCISSKLVSRSLSFQEELNKNMQRSANGIPALEELAISGNINDQLLALVCTANTVAYKYRSGSFSDKSNKPVAEPDIALTKTKWELASSLAQGGEAKHAGLEAQLLLPQIPSINNPIKRSRSCHLLSTNEVSCPSLERLHGLEEKKMNHKGVGRAKSFHTVEEFDALIKNLKLSREEQQIGCDGENDGLVKEVQLNHFQSSSHASDDHSRWETHSCIKDRTPPEAKYSITEESTSSTLELVSRKQITIPSRSHTTPESEVAEDSPDQRHSLKEGFKRKSIAKRLESLDIPQTIEFPAVAGLEEWLRLGGQVYSPGAYVTPKFGSYSLPICGTSNECNEEPVFNPELVAACEESMEQLEAEAESILRQIVENLEEESAMGMEKQAKDNFFSHSN